MRYKIKRDVEDKDIEIPYRFFGDGATEIREGHGFGLMAEFFRHFNSDYNSSENAFKFMSLNEEPIFHKSGEVGNNYYLLQVKRCFIASITSEILDIEFQVINPISRRPVANLMNAIKKGDKIQFSDGVPGLPNIRSIMTGSCLKTSCPVQIRSLSDSDSDKDGIVRFSIYPKLKYIDGNKNISDDIKIGILASSLGDHKFGIIYNKELTPERSMYVIFPPEQDLLSISKLSHIKNPIIHEPGSSLGILPDDIVVNENPHPFKFPEASGNNGDFLYQAEDGSTYWSTPEKEKNKKTTNDSIKWGDITSISGTEFIRAVPPLFSCKDCKEPMGKHEVMHFVKESEDVYVGQCDKCYKEIEEYKKLDPLPIFDGENMRPPHLQDSYLNLVEMIDVARKCSACPNELGKYDGEGLCDKCRAMNSKKIIDNHNNGSPLMEGVIYKSPLSENETITGSIECISFKKYSNPDEIQEKIDSISKLEWELMRTNARISVINACFWLVPILSVAASVSVMIFIRSKGLI